VTNSTIRAIQQFRQHQGLLRTAQAMRLGIAPRTLYALRDSGAIVPVSRGLYRLADLPPRQKNAIRPRASE
jgi:Transcriptional regulator, AbiEi antitoxin